MKKTVFTVLLLVGILTGLTACGSNNDILKKMSEANARENLIQKHGFVAWLAKVYNTEGKSTDVYQYESNDYNVADSMYSTQIYENGDSYGIYPVSADEYVPFRFLIAGDEAKRRFEETSFTSPIIYDEQEKLISSEVKGDFLFVTTTTDKTTDNDDAWIEITGNDLESVKEIKYIYKLDKDSLEFQTITFLLVMENGDEVKFQEVTRVYDCEKYEPDRDAIYDAVFNGEQKTVSLTLEPGTDKEQTYTQTVSMDGDILLSLPEEYEELTVYTDRECTQEFDYDLWTGATSYELYMQK